MKKFSRGCALTNYKKYACVKQTEQGERLVWTKALQTAINENRYLYIPKGKYYLDDSIVLSSNKHIKASRHAEIILLKSCKKLLLRNADVMDGSFVAIPKSAPKTENIRIEGGIWSECHTSRLGYGESGAFDEEDSLHGVTCTMLFSGVKNLVLRNMTFAHSAGFCIQIGRCENFEVKNIRCVQCYADGVHVNGDVKNGYVYHIHGEVRDDLVALNAYDWDKSTINNGAIENVVVKNVCAPKNGEWYKAFRIQPGVVQGKNGDIDCYIKDLHIKNVKGVSVVKMYLQTPPYYEKPDNVRVGWMENVTFENVEVNACQPIDKLSNYLTGDSLAGHFGAFEFGSNIHRVSFKNVRVRLDKEKYPLSHLITVGPKSQYLPKRGEIFDPYVACVVDGLYYKNVKVNGQKVKDIKKEIFEVSLPDDMYENQFGKGGSGKIKNIIHCRRSATPKRTNRASADN